MKYLLRFFMIFMVVCVVTNCASPVGSVDGGGGDSAGNGIEFNSILVIPNRQLYEVDEFFEREDDLRIFTAENGRLIEVSPTNKDISIEIVENPGLSSETAIPLESSYYRFTLPGRIIIRVTYQENKSGHYSVTVQGSFDTSGDGSDFMGYIWI